MAAYLAALRERLRAALTAVHWDALTVGSRVPLMAVRSDIPKVENSAAPKVGLTESN